MWTDTSNAHGRELIQQLEHLRQVVLGVAFPNDTAANGKSFVIALRDGEEVGAYIPEQFIAYASGDGNPARRPMILLPADVDGSDAHVITHELTHVISYNVIRHQPPWFAEGIAGFFATVRLDAGLENVDVGQPLDHVVQSLRYSRPKSARALFACRENICMDEMFYATTWALFSFLANEHPAELLKLEARLDELPDQEQAKAWSEVFPELTPEALDHELAGWLAHGRHVVWHFKAKLQDWPVTERKLADGDVYAARALLRMMFKREGAEAELATALAAETCSRTWSTPRRRSRSPRAPPARWRRLIPTIGGPGTSS
ncbi:MAG: hypothetical protein JWO36_1365 [Myxococcales bacterium]|nr:hypothetical protein [Myxococcales bacterium]